MIKKRETNDSSRKNRWQKATSFIQKMLAIDGCFYCTNKRMQTRYKASKTKDKENNELGKRRKG